MPRSNNNILVSGAADTTVKVFNVTLAKTLLTCHCHKGRVKKVVTDESTPFLFWSAGEDGAVLQYDLRAPHECQSRPKAVLVDLRTHVGRYAEAKCLAVNTVRPELIAIGANDPYIRMYDRRMLKFSRPVSFIP